MVTTAVDTVPVLSIGFRPEVNFRRAVEKANAVYLFGRERTAESR